MEYYAECRKSKRKCPIVLVTLGGEGASREVWEGNGSLHSELGMGISTREWVGEKCIEVWLLRHCC